MSEMSEIDQVHLRAVMLFMSETSEIVIIFNIHSARKFRKLQSTPNTPTMITIAILITTLLANIITYLQEILETTKKAAQIIKNTTTKISHDKLFQNIKKSYKTAVLAVNLVTSTMGRTSRMKQPCTTNGNTQKSPGM